MSYLQSACLTAVSLLLLAQVGLGFADDSAPCQLANYSVSATGNDSTSCVSANSTSKGPCRTLVYLLRSIQNQSCVDIIVSNDQNFSNTVITIHSVQNWTIESNQSASGQGQIEINCSGESGLVFENSSGILIEGVLFVGCSVISNYTTEAEDNYPLVETSALYFFKGSDVKISNCGFHNGSGTGVTMNGVGGIVLLRGTNFIGNAMSEPTEGNANLTSGGLIVRTSYYLDSNDSFMIDNCNFVQNMNYECHYKNDSLMGVGGGATFNLSSSASITITNSLFSNNTACQGGGLQVYKREIGSTVSMTLISSSFEHNHAFHEGGGIYAHLTDGFLSTLNLHFLNTTFFNNSGEFGGGLAIYNGIKDGDIHMTATDSVWSQNNALYSGFGVGLSAPAVTAARPSNSSSFHIEAHFMGCSFLSNSNFGFYRTLNAVGAVQLKGAKAIFNDTIFSNNSGTALHIRYFSYAEFVGDNLFDSNNGNKGGAVLVDNQSLLSLKEGSLIFCDNHATMDGGALYVEYSKEDDTECIFESLRSLLNSSDFNEVEVSFFNNTAGNLNQSIFIGSASGCISSHTGNVSMEDIILFDSHIFTYFPNDKSQVASLADAIHFKFMPNTSTDYIKVMPGEKFYLIPTVKDIFGNDAYQYGNLALELHQENPSEADYQLVGPRFINLDDFTKNNELSIKADRSMIGQDGLVLEFVYFQHSSYHDGGTDVAVHLTDCKLGFTFNESTKICQCQKTSNLVCASSSHSYACVRYGYWHGNSSEGTGDTLLCPGQNCYFVDGKCPEYSKVCPGAPDFCRLEAVDGLCWIGRSGVLCSECQSNHSFTFHALRCVPSHTCSPLNTSMFVLGLIVYWILLVLFFLFILSVELSMGGIIYGVMYYFSVVEIFTDKTVTDFFLKRLIDTCVAVTQLSPRIIGNIHICFVESWTSNLQHQLFRYVTPIAVIILIVVVIVMSRFCRCPKGISPAQNSPIHAMCILVLACYTSLTYTSFELLRPIQIDGQLMSYSDPKYRYFHKAHLPYALVAIFFEFFVCLPVCFLVIFAPCISRRVSTTKIRLRFKPILDEFQACYRPECRWFAGFYFLTRQLIFFVNIIPTNSLPEDNTYIHAINAAIFIIHCSFQPYKLKWLNLIDGLLLADIIFLSFFHLEYGSGYSHSKVIGYILILLPAIYLGLLIIAILLKRVSYCFVNVRVFRNRIKPKIESVRELPSNIPSQTSVTINDDDDNKPSIKSFDASFFRDTGEREPLLADHEDTNHSSYSSNEGVRFFSVFNRSRSQHRAS